MMWVWGIGDFFWGNWFIKVSRKSECRLEIILWSCWYAYYNMRFVGGVFFVALKPFLKICYIIFQESVFVYIETIESCIWVNLWLKNWLCKNIMYSIAYLFNYFNHKKEAWIARVCHSRNRTWKMFDFYNWNFHSYQNSNNK